MPKYHYKKPKCQNSTQVQVLHPQIALPSIVKQILLVNGGWSGQFFYPAKSTLHPISEHVRCCLGQTWPEIVSWTRGLATAAVRGKPAALLLYPRRSQRHGAVALQHLRAATPGRAVRSQPACCADARACFMAPTRCPPASTGQRRSPPAPAPADAAAARAGRLPRTVHARVAMDDLL